jgi:hypothetical protein
MNGVKALAFTPFSVSFILFGTYGVYTRQRKLRNVVGQPLD